MSVSLPMIVKYVETSHNGIQSQNLDALCDRIRIARNEVHLRRRPAHGDREGSDLFLGIGHHYIEDVPEKGQPFEQIMIYYRPDELQRILMHLNITYGLGIHTEHYCERCMGRKFVGTPGWPRIRTFFTNLNGYLRDEQFRHDDAAENIKMTELIYHIVSHDDGCIKSKILNNIDVEKESFEQLVFDNIFKDVSIEELASEANRSLTSFKKEFRKALRTSAAQVVHPSAAHARPAAADLHVVFGFRRSAPSAPSPTRRTSSNSSRRSMR